MPGGRKRSAIHELFNDEQGTSSTVKRVSCNLCKGSLSKNGTRMEKHAKECMSIPENIKRKYISSETRNTQMV